MVNRVRLGEALTSVSGDRPVSESEAEREMAAECRSPLAGGTV